MMWIFWISQSGHFFSMAFKGIQNLKKTHFNLIMVIFKKLIFTTYQNSAIPAIWSYVSSAAFLFEFYLSSSNTNHQSLIFNYVLLLCLVVSEINDKQSCKKSRWFFIPRSIDPELVKEKINSFKFFYYHPFCDSLTLIPIVNFNQIEKSKFLESCCVIAKCFKMCNFSFKKQSRSPPIYLSNLQALQVMVKIILPVKQKYLHEK